MAAQLDINATAAADPPVTRSPTVQDTLESVTALARFEFEPGRGNDGTKILMVEWQDDNKSRHKSGSWQVSWLGKRTTFAADDNPSDSTNRLYFLLPPGETIPPSIKITYQPPKHGRIPSSSTNEKPSNLQSSGHSPHPSSRAAQSDPATLHMTVHPLPAIFTPELGATAKASGKKGVLHTIWAKRRLQVLAREIRSESDFNLEGIALEMALAEKQWIEQNFGIATPQSHPKPQTPAPGGLKLDLGAINSGIASPPLSPSMQSPTSPGGRRLTDKLKGLSLMTSDTVNTPTRETNPLSPDIGDMAVSSFSAFKGDRPSGKPPLPTAKKIIPISPPSEVTDDQAQSASASLAEIARGETPARSDEQPMAGSSRRDGAEGAGEDLFAVAMSPRSPDAPKSPFSIPSGEEVGGVPGGGAFSRIKGIQTK